jgi:hypothetical protein
MCLAYWKICSIFTTPDEISIKLLHLVKSLGTHRKLINLYYLLHSVLTHIMHIILILIEVILSVRIAK